MPKLRERAAYAIEAINDKLIEHRHYVNEYGDDRPEITGWKWGQRAPVSARTTSTEADNV